MKKIILFLIAASLVAFISCSKSHTEIVDEETSLDIQSRGNGSQNVSVSGGVSATQTPWIEVSDGIVATETPKDEAKKDSIPNDSIPSDSIPNDSTKID